MGPYQSGAEPAHNRPIRNDSRLGTIVAELRKWWSPRMRDTAGASESSRQALPI